MPRQLSGPPGRHMACGLVFRVMTDDPAGCRAGPAELPVMERGIALGGTAPATAAADTV